LSEEFEDDDPELLGDDNDLDIVDEEEEEAECAWCGEMPCKCAELAEAA